MGKKIAFLIAGSLVGILISTVALPYESKASLLDNIINVFKFGGTIPTVTSTQGTQENTSQDKQGVSLYQPAVDYENMVVRAVQEAEPSVVSIVISEDLPIIESCPYDPFGNLPPDIRRRFFDDDLFGFEQPCERRFEKRETGSGSGFIVSSDGLIVTNKHVVRNPDAEYTVLTNDGQKLSARVLARDPAQDIAIIKVESSNLKPAILGNSDSVKLGQTAIAIGNALGEFRNTVSVGVISGLARNITASGGGFSERIEGLIQTDAAINQGNSGGPLLNLKGEVIGVSTAVATDAENIGFAIPINQVKRDVSSVKTSGKIKIPYLGVRYIPVTPELAKNQKLPVDFGALVRGNDDGPGVIPDSPAYAAGVKAEDIIIEADGERIDKDKSLGSIVQKRSIGDVLSLKIRRGADTLTLKATLRERPEGE